MKQEHQQLIEDIRNIKGPTAKTISTLNRAVKAIEELSKTVDYLMLEVETIKKDRDHWRKMADDTHTIAQRDQASEAADKLASAILGEDIDWSDHSAKWEEALERLPDITSERDHWRAEAERWRECREATVEAAPRLRWMLESHGTATGTTIKRKLQWFDGSEWLDVRIPPAPEAEQTSTGIDIWTRTCGQMIEDRDAWRTMALALVEKINPPTAINLAHIQTPNQPTP